MWRRTATALRSRIQAAAASAQSTQLEGFATASKAKAAKPAVKQVARPKPAAAGGASAKDEDRSDKKHSLLLKVRRVDASPVQAMLSYSIDDTKCMLPDGGGALRHMPRNPGQRRAKSNSKFYTVLWLFTRFFPVINPSDSASSLGRVINMAMRFRMRSRPQKFL